MKQVWKTPLAEVETEVEIDFALTGLEDYSPGVADG